MDKLGEWHVTFLGKFPSDQKISHDVVSFIFNFGQERGGEPYIRFDSCSVNKEGEEKIHYPLCFRYYEAGYRLARTFFESAFEQDPVEILQKLLEQMDISFRISFLKKYKRLETDSITPDQLLAIEKRITVQGGQWMPLKGTIFPVGYKVRVATLYKSKIIQLSNMMDEYKSDPNRSWPDAVEYIQAEINKIEASVGKIGIIDHYIIAHNSHIVRFEDSETLALPPECLELIEDN